MSKIKTTFKIIKYFKNWITYFEDYFGLIKKEKIVYFLRNGIKYNVRVGTVDRQIINEIWLHKFYTPKDFEIKENYTIVDIGAQIGVFSLFASKLAKNGKIFSFEPVPENFKMLTENIKLNNVQNIIPINKAIGDRDGQEAIFLSENKGGHSFVNLLKDSKSKIDVSTISLRSFFEGNKIFKVDFLKMDCEGAEYKILFACPKEILQKIKRISMEYHNIDKDNNVETLKKFLENNGYKVIVKSDNCNMLYANR